MGRNIIAAFCLLFCLVLFGYAQPQTPAKVDTLLLKKLINYTSELEFELALSKYVEQLFVDYGIEKLPEEKYLVTLMRLINDEMRERIENPKLAREVYFNDLYRQLDDLNALRQRLNASGITELDSYVNELDSRIQLMIKRGEINYKKKKVLEDALQMLFVAEEMIRMDQVASPQQLDNKISSSKDKLLNAFGEVEATTNEPLPYRPTIFNLYDEWRKAEEYRFTYRLLDVKLARTKLLKSAQLQQIARMFKNQLRTAYVSFNYGDFDLADRLLEDLVETYPTFGVRDLEDVLYYWAESNFALGRFLRAREIYSRLLNDYSGTRFLKNVYGRLAYIACQIEDDALLESAFNQYQRLGSVADQEYVDLLLMVGLRYFETGNFTRANDVLMSIPRTSDYYYLAQYLVGTVYAAAQNYEMAKGIFGTLLQDLAVPLPLRNRVLYKMALIVYEDGGYVAALEYLGQIPETYYRYDKVLNAMAWSAFMLEQHRTNFPEERDYSQAKYYAHRLIDEYYASEHRMEAEGLLAYIYQRENSPNMALNLYKDVYEAKAKKRAVQDFLEERDRLQGLLKEARQMEEKAMRENNKDAYLKASDLASDLESRIYQMDLAEFGSVGSSLTREIAEILNQIDQLNELKEQARRNNNVRAMMKIDSTLIRLSVTLERFPADYYQKALAYNWFDAYPVTRKVVEHEFKVKKNRQIRQTIKAEMHKIDEQEAFLQQQVEAAKAAGDYKKVVELERKIDRLGELRKNYDRLYASSFQLSEGEGYAEFDQWGDFGAFGVIDVNFGQRDRLQAKMKDVSQLYTSVTDLLSQRRQELEDRFKKIEAEIRFMTMKARLEERVRQRAERERSFRETYFDKRTSEFEEK